MNTIIDTKVITLILLLFISSGLLVYSIKSLMHAIQVYKEVNDK